MSEAPDPISLGSADFSASRHEGQQASLPAVDSSWIRHLLQAAFPDPAAEGAVSSVCFQTFRGALWPSCCPFPRWLCPTLRLCPDFSAGSSGQRLRCLRVFLSYSTEHRACKEHTLSSFAN